LDERGRGGARLEDLRSELVADWQYKEKERKEREKEALEQALVVAPQGTRGNPSEAPRVVPLGEEATYSAPLLARVHLRAGSWRWQIVSQLGDNSEVHSAPCPCISDPLGLPLA
jgi:hypothetical protein